ncbi:hypothetical protein GC101_18100 [Paenibacillus sp. LMG 31459]|uniref:Flp pilus assembly protein RcpC/CpaB domain-containing protein n=1 Tax=Paenibacillus phytohabitans TaxID=2654978 RepID=A0ABX1YIV9_9BACL|nr:RcpC/CpaB family pilus assembly protein [Paenibacillus phytohabitans]NOU80778.1 hypothetical protein [Paenibacillus phytohabitans]
MKRFWNKYTRALTLIILGIAILVVVNIVQSKNISNQVDTQRIVVAKQDIAPFTEITKDKLQYRDVVLSEVPVDAVLDAGELKFGDLYAGEYGIRSNEPVRTTYNTTSLNSQVGSSIGLKEGMTEIGIATDLARSAGDDAKPGVYVNIIAYVRDEATNVSRKVVDPKLTNIKVLKRLNSEGTTPDAASGDSLIPAVVVLEVTPEQAAAIMEYQETGKVYLLPLGIKP